MVYLEGLLRITLLSAGIMLCGCKDYDGLVPECPDVPVRVVLAMGDIPETKTAYDFDDKCFVWRTGDEISVWAKDAACTYSLEGHTFSLLAKGREGASAYFTSTLQSPMPEGTYSYYMTYPLPESVNGTTAEFKIPELQDGTASDGVDIVVAEPVA